MKNAQIKTAAPFDQADLDRIEQKLRQELNDDVTLIVEIVPELIGGFTVSVGGKLYDMSMSSTLSELRTAANLHRQHGADAPDPMDEEDRKQIFQSMDDHFRARLKSIPQGTRVYDYGTVISSADGICTIDGLNHSLSGELLKFDNGAFGMAMELTQKGVGAVILSSAEGVAAGMSVRGTGEVVSVPVGDELLGRVVDPLGQPLDGATLETSKTRPAECPAPGIMDRAPVSEPLMTGILAIDSMIPIGKGQRELIIGDRQMGKSVIALSAMLNQASRGVVCVYCAIGQKASTVAQFIDILKKRGAMSNCIVVAATSATSAAMQYLAPYAAAAIAEHFMYNGQDALVVYDDLSKHAQSYRTMSLLLKRPPGREAYPGDVFYLHSRLLERAAKLTPEKGGGSMTALPIVETMAGDISAYIPTNVISITDGQIYLESELFHAGVRPAVNVGLSVSRVGRAAQPPAMRKVSSQLRLKLAQYRELAVFAQFDSDLDQSTQKLLLSGEHLTVLLKQDQNTIYKLSEQVALLLAFNEGLFNLIALGKLLDTKQKLLEYLYSNARGAMAQIDGTGDLTDEVRQALIKLIADFFDRINEAQAK